MSPLRLVPALAVVAAAAGASAAHAVCVNSPIAHRPGSVCVNNYATVDGLLVSGWVTVDCTAGNVACAIDPIGVGPTGVAPDGGLYVDGRPVNVAVPPLPYVEHPCERLVACP